MGYNLVHKNCVLTEVPLLKLKKGLYSFLGTVNYLCKYSLATSEICKMIRMDIEQNILIMF